MILPLTKYNSLATDLMVKRIAGTLTEKDEDCFSDEMEALWWKMTKEERETVRASSKGLLFE